MIYGLQTSFDSRIAASDLTAVYDYGFRWVRIDAQQSSVETMHAMIADAEAANLYPLVILYDLEMLAEMPPGRWVEWGNELDFTLEAKDYRDALDDAALLASQADVPLVAPCISNLDRDSLRWLADVRADGWPQGVTAISVHRYGDHGSFEWAHKGFDSREDEVSALVELCDGLPWLVTEFGYQTGDQDNAVSETMQAANIAAEWQFWRVQGAMAAFLYQINDGTGEHEGYGIRTVDGRWKPAAETVPREGA